MTFMAHQKKLHILASQLQVIYYPNLSANSVKLYIAEPKVSMLNEHLVDSDRCRSCYGNKKRRENEENRREHKLYRQFCSHLLSPLVSFCPEYIRIYSQSLCQACAELVCLY